MIYHHDDIKSLHHNSRIKIESIVKIPHIPRLCEKPVYHECVSTLAVHYNNTNLHSQAVSAIVNITK